MIELEWEGTLPLVLGSSGSRAVYLVSGLRCCFAFSPTSQPFRFRASLQSVTAPSDPPRPAPWLREEEQGSTAPLRLGSPACKYLLPLGESYYSACAPHAKSLSKHAQMTALGIPRHAFYPCLGLVTIVLRPRGSALLVTLWRATLYTPHPGPPQGSIFSLLGPAELAWPLPESGSGW